MNKKILGIFIVMLLITTSLSAAGILNANKNYKLKNKDDQFKYYITNDPLWKSYNGPPGGRINELIQNPYNKNELYAISVQGIHKSESSDPNERGETWSTLSGTEEMHDITSLALYEEKLFFCDDSAVYEYNNGNIKKISNEACSKLVVSNDKLFMTGNWLDLDNPRNFIMYTDLTSTDYRWIDITPSKSVLGNIIKPDNSDDPYWFEVPNIISIETIILATINLLADVGSGEESNGQLFISEDSGNSWDIINIDALNPENPADKKAIIYTIVQGEDDPYHIFLLLRISMSQFNLPASDLILESNDGGKTWQTFDDISTNTNQVTDVVKIGDYYYFTIGSGILKVNSIDNNYFLLPPAIIDGFENSVTFDKILVDPDDMNVVYGNTEEKWAMGMLKTNEGIESEVWKKMGKEIVASSPTIVLTNPKSNDIIYCSGNVIQEKYFTEDGGLTWKPFSALAGDDLKVDPHNYDHILLIDEMSDIYESYDTGNSLHLVNGKSVNNHFTAVKIFDIEVAPDDSEKIYFSNIGTGISTSNEQTATIDYMSGSSDYAYDIEIDPENSDMLWATYSPKIFEGFSALMKYDPEYNDNFGWAEITRYEGSTGMSEVEFDPDDPDRIYVGVLGEKGTIYSTHDKGESWQKLNQHFTFATIHEMAIDSNNENIVYAGPWGGGLYISHNYGETWTELHTPTISVSSILVDPNDPDHIIIGDRTKPAIYESYDQGDTWETLVSLSEDDYYRISTMILHNGQLYFSAFNLIDGLIGVFTDGPMAGTVFTLENGEPVKITDGITRSTLSFSSNNIDLYAVSHIQGIYRLEGDTWIEVSQDLPDMGFNHILIDNDGDVFASSGCDIDLYGNRRIGDDNIVNNIYLSEDEGETWMSLLVDNPFSSGVKKLLQHPTNPSIYYAATGTGVYMWDGTVWTDQYYGLNFRNIASMVLGENYIYVGTAGGGVYTSRIDPDYSLDWRESTGPFPEIYNIQVRINPADSNVLYASAYPGGVYKSIDKGETWVESNFALPSFEVDDPGFQGYYSLEIDPNNPEILYLGIFGKGVYKSYDGAAIWMPMYGTFGQNKEIMKKGITQIRVDPVDSDKLYLATNDGFYVSYDGAKNWVSMNDGLQTSDIKCLEVQRSSWIPFIDDFEDGNFDGWESDGGWSVVDLNGNLVLEGTGHRWIGAGAGNWRDYSFSSRVMLANGGVHINFRVNDDGRYFLGFNEGGLGLVKQYDNWNKFKDLTQVDEDINLNQWYTIKINVRSNEISVYVDNDLKLSYVDADNPLTNGRIAYESLDDSQVYVDDVEVIPESPESLVYIGTVGYGAYTLNSDNIWENVGKTVNPAFWTPWNRRMYQFSSIVFDPNVLGKVYLGHFPSGFFISEDNGHHWKDSSIGLGNDGMFSLTMHPSDHDILWAGTYNGVSKSTDQGNTWVLKGKKGIEDLKEEDAWEAWENHKEGIIAPEQWPYTIAIDSDNPDIMYISTKNGRNKGFKHRNCPDGVGDRNNFAGIVMKSTDGGETWFEIMNDLDWGNEYYNLIIYPKDHNVLFLSSSNGVYLSRDAGNSWESIDEGLPTTWNQVRDNVADNLVLTSDDKYLLLGLYGFGIWKADISKLKLKIDKQSIGNDCTTLEVTMPKNKAINPFLLLLERLMERFPILEQILLSIYDKLA